MDAGVWALGFLARLVSRVLGLQSFCFSISGLARDWMTSYCGYDKTGWHEGIDCTFQSCYPPETLNPKPQQRQAFRCPPRSTGPM